MIYLIENLSTTYTLVVPSTNYLVSPPTNYLGTNSAHASVTDAFSINYLYTNSTHIYDAATGAYFINGIIFANVVYPPTGPDSSANIQSIIDYMYHSNRQQILLNNKNKFIITIVQFKSDNTKDLLYANSYLNLIEDEVEYTKLLQDSPWHHYEILNYKTEKFEVHIKCDDAIQKLNQYIDEFVIEYRPNIVKEFLYKKEFLEYITNNI